jgi:hypothetical protein
MVLLFRAGQRDDGMASCMHHAPWNQRSTLGGSSWEWSEVVRMRGLGRCAHTAHCTLHTAHCKEKSDVPVGELSYARGRRLMNSCGGSPAPCPALRMGARRDLIGPGLVSFA